MLLATKLHVPHRQPGFVGRPRLMQALDEGLARRLILVCAPAGFGKTALLADWARRGDRPVAWLSLDAGDNDPARFWRHAVAALDRARPGIGERVGALLGPPAPASFEGLVTALINELAAEPGQDELLMVLDDYHLIDAQPVHEPLVFLLQHLPPGVHLVLASRSDPPLPLARLRAAGQLAELRAGDLRFTAEEAATLLRESVGDVLPAAAVVALAARTEGWAAGLQLAGLSLRGRPDVAGFVAAFSGTYRYVLDYLTDEVLEGQTGQVREFLLETSVLDRLSGELCDAVTGRTGGQVMLEQVEQAGLFLVPLDEVRGWWRYHHLFADLLRARLQQQQPGRVAGLHQNAAAWYEEHGLADDAVRHALAAGDASWAARLIERHFDEIFWPGERATVERWLSALPAGLAGSRPRLCLLRAILALAGGDIEGAGPLLDAADRAVTDAAEEPFEPSAGEAASLLVNVPAAIALGRASLAQLRGDANGTAAFASQALAKTGEGESMLDSTSTWLLAVAEWLRGRVAEAERAFAASITGWRAAGERYSAAYGCHHLGQVQRARGRLDAALGSYQQALEITAAPGRLCLRLGSPSSAWGRWLTSGTNSRLRCARSAMALSDAGHSPTPSRWPRAWPPWRGSGRPGGTTLVRWRRWARPGGRRRARPWPACSTPSRRRGRGCCWPRARSPRPPAGQKNAASARMMTWATRMSRSIWYWPGSCSPRTAPPRRSRCWGGCTRRPPPRGVREVSSRSRRCRRSRWPPQATRARRWTPWPRRSCSAARKATSGCSPTRARRWPRCWPGWSRRRRQTTLLPAAVPLSCLARLLRAFGEPPAAAGARQHAAAAVPGLVEQLTARELEILALLAAGTPNPRIAKQLVVSLDTVKKHVSHLLGKLGAANRTEAVTRARELGLIP